MFGVHVPARKVLLKLFGVAMAFTIVFSITNVMLGIQTASAQEETEDPGFFSRSIFIPGTAIPNPLFVSDAVGAATDAALDRVASKAAEAAVQKVTHITFEAVASFMAPLTQLVVRISIWFLGVTGLFFDFIVAKTIVGAYGTIIKNDGIRTGLQSAWVVIRDLINISFIFILLYQAIMLMIGRSNEASKVIVKLVAVALLINFSMFFTRVVIDASNVIATGFYDQIIPPGSNGFTSISTVYTQALGISSTFSGSIEQLAKEGIGSGDNYIILLRNLGAITFILISAFVFIAAAIMLLTRYIAILFLMVLSPVAFAGLIIPASQGISKRWWNSLVGQSIFAPVFMILTWVNLTVASSMFQAKSTTETLGAIFSQNGGSGSTFENGISALFNFSLIIGLSLASLIIAKKASSMGGNYFSSVNKFIGNAALSTASFAGRNTLGWGASRIADNEKLRNSNNWFARQSWRAANRASTSSFDLRNAPGGIGGQVFGDLGSATGAGGYRKGVEVRAEGKQKEIEARATASQETNRAYDDAQNARRAAQRAYLAAPEGQARLEAREVLRKAEKEEKKAKAAVDFETNQNKARLAGQLTTRRIGNAALPSAASYKAESDIIDNIKTKDKDLQKQEEIADISSALNKTIEEGDTDRAKEIFNKTNISDFPSLPIKDIFNVDNDSSKQAFSDALIPLITSDHLDKLRRKGDIDNPTRDAISQRLTGAANVHDSIKRMKASPNADFWGINPSSSGGSSNDGSSRIVGTDSRGNIIT